MSDGGLAVTLAESCFESSGLSADVDLRVLPRRTERPAENALFGERGARAVVSFAGASLARAQAAIAAQYGVQALRIGTVTRGEFRIQYKGAPAMRGAIDSFRRVWTESLEKALEANA